MEMGRQTEVTEKVSTRAGGDSVSKISKTVTIEVNLERPTLPFIMNTL